MIPTENGLEIRGENHLDLIPSEPLNALTFAEATVALEANYGVDYSIEKMKLLYDIMMDEGWSEHRFRETLKWFIKNKPFPAWTIADWFGYGIKVFPIEWCHQMLLKGYSWERDIESYEIDGIAVYKLRDGNDLPFLKRY